MTSMSMLKIYVGGLVGLLMSCLVIAAPEVARGYHLSLFAQVPNARQMALSDNGTLFVGSRAEGKVHAVLPDGEIKLLVSGLNMPSGLALNKAGDLYIAAVNSIYRLKNAQVKVLANKVKLELLNDELPSASHHGWKFIDFNPKTGNLIVPVGAPCNVCLVYPQSGNEPFGTLLSLNIQALNQGKLKYQVLAQGVRNSVGFDWHPQTGQLWFTDNGRDWMGDDTPPCEINRIKQTDSSRPLHFGFPFKHGDIDETDVEILAAKPKHLMYEPPMVKLQAHSAPLGMMFYTGKQSSLQGALLVAEHGSWNRTTPVGYRLSAYWFDQGKVSRHQVLVNWLVNGNKLGRPVDIVQTKDDALLVSDDATGTIWKLVIGDTKSP